MASNYLGVHLIGNKATRKITDVAVVDIGGSTIPLPLVEYINRGVEPPYQTLPWEEDTRAGIQEPLILRLCYYLLDNPNSLLTRLFVIANSWGCAWVIGWVLGSSVAFYLFGALGTVMGLRGFQRKYPS